MMSLVTWPEYLILLAGMGVIAIGVIVYTMLGK